jgi:phage N-6-adenine-methyltransferase
MTFNKEVMWSTKSGDWETPQDVFDEVNRAFGPFTLDVCADESNYKVEKYLTEEVDGLNVSWEGNLCWMNPPYSVDAEREDGTKYRKRVIQLWVKKAYLEALKPNTSVVAILPSRTDTRWFHNYVAKGYVWFLKGRLKFSGYDKAAPVGHLIVEWRFDDAGQRQMTEWLEGGETE